MANKVYTFEGFWFDVSRGNLYDGDGRPVRLTSSEFDLLSLFCSRPQQAVSRDAIREALHPDVRYRAIDVKISRLRNKLEPRTKRPWGGGMVRTIRHAGYYFTPQVRPLDAAAA